MGRSIMLTLPVAGLRIQREVAEAEAAMNAAVAATAKLTASIAEARNLPEIDAATGHTAMLHLASLSQHLMIGTGKLARAHGELRSINDQRRIVMMPDYDGPCPPTTGELSEVEAA